MDACGDVLDRQLHKQVQEIDLSNWETEYYIMGEREFLHTNVPLIHPT